MSRDEACGIAKWGGKCEFAATLTNVGNISGSQKQATRPELMTCTFMTRDVRDHMVDRYSEQEENHAEPSARVSLKTT